MTIDTYWPKDREWPLQATGYDKVREALKVFLEDRFPAIHDPAQVLAIADHVITRYIAKPDCYAETDRAEALAKIADNEVLDRFDSRGGGADRHTDPDSWLAQDLFGGQVGKDDVLAVMTELVEAGEREEFRVAVTYLDIACLEGLRPDARMVAEVLQIDVGLTQYLLSRFRGRLGRPSPGSTRRSA